jgi:Tol biopolymer transport system component
MSARLRARWLVAPALLALIATAAVVLLSGQSTQASPGQTFRVSVDSSGNQANADSDWPPDISADGRFVAFASYATNLVVGDTNGVRDVFVHDRQTGETSRVSVDSAGSEANGSSGAPAISADGRYVAFHSAASDLVAGDTNQCGYGGPDPGMCPDVFVHDRNTGQTVRVSVDSSGNQGSGRSDWPSISGDGRYVAFSSLAPDLVPGDTNDRSDIFLHDLETGETSRVSVDSGGNQLPSLSSGWYTHAVSFDGRYVAFRYGGSAIYVRDRQAGTTELVSVNTAGDPANDISDAPAISADGRYVAFSSIASNLAPGDFVLCPGDWGLFYNCDDVFVHDRNTGVTERVSMSSAGVGGNWISGRPVISSDGLRVAFDSVSTNLVPDDTNGSIDVFVRDRQVGQTTRVSVDSGGNQSDGGSSAAISADGRYVVFASSASNLVPGDTNGAGDIFVHDRLLPFWTPTSTPEGTSTDTPTVTPNPAPDSDGDGCTDPEEVAVGFDPLAWYDYYDVPIPANNDPTPNGTRDRSVNLQDLVGVLKYVGTSDGGASNGRVDYDSDKNADTVEDGRDYDRSPGPEPNPPYDAGPPDGAVNLQDVVAVLRQVGLACSAPVEPTTTATATPTASPTPTATPTPNPAAINAAVQATADLLSVPPGSVTVLSVEPQDWPDTCLGLGQPGDVCGLVITPGYRITVTAVGYTIAWRTDLNGSEVRLETMY